jgi:hypothetical protein
MLDAQTPSGFGRPARSVEGSHCRGRGPDRTANLPAAVLVCSGERSPLTCRVWDREPPATGDPIRNLDQVPPASRSSCGPESRAAGLALPGGPAYCRPARRPSAAGRNLLRTRWRGFSPMAGLASPRSQVPGLGMSSPEVAAPPKHRRGQAGLAAGWSVPPACAAEPCWGWGGAPAAEPAWPGRGLHSAATEVGVSPAVSRLCSARPAVRE